MPDAIIQRYIDAIENYLADRLGTTYTNVDQDPITYSSEAYLFRCAISKLVMCNLLYENYVVTGFGTVIKKDEFSINQSENDIMASAKGCAKDAVRYLEAIPGISPKEAALIVFDLQYSTESFFSDRKSDIYKYFPYIHI